MAINESNIQIDEFSNYLFDSVDGLSKETSSDSFSYGDLVDNDAYNGEVDVVGEADKSQFIGVSLKTIDGSTDTTSKISAVTKCVIRAPLDTGESTIYFGEAAAWGAGGNGTKWELANTATEAICHCRSASVTADNSGLFLIDPFTVRAVTALGFFELFG